MVHTVHGASDRRDWYESVYQSMGGWVGKVGSETRREGSELSTVQYILYSVCEEYLTVLYLHCGMESSVHRYLPQTTRRKHRHGRICMGQDLTR